MQRRRRKGFQQAGGLVSTQVRKGAEGRGFARVRLLTHWNEIAGADIAARTRPVKVSYAKAGMGATLTLLCPGAMAPLIQMQIPDIIKRINAVYGHNAVQRIHLTQTASSGFGEVAAGFERSAPEPLSPQEEAEIADHMSEIGDDSLKTALETLAKNIKSRNK